MPREKLKKDDILTIFKQPDWEEKEININNEKIIYYSYI